MNELIESRAPAKWSRTAAALLFKGNAPAHWPGPGTDPRSRFALSWMSRRRGGRSARFVGDSRPDSAAQENGQDGDFLLALARAGAGGGRSRGRFFPLGRRCSKAPWTELLTEKPFHPGERAGRTDARAACESLERRCSRRAGLARRRCASFRGRASRWSSFTCAPCRRRRIESHDRTHYHPHHRAHHADGGDSAEGAEHLCFFSGW